MAEALYYSGPLSTVVRRHATGKDETPVRQKYGDPDGGPSVLVPGKESTAAFLDLLFKEAFSKEAVWLKPSRLRGQGVKPKPEPPKSTALVRSPLKLPNLVGREPVASGAKALPAPAERKLLTSPEPLIDLRKPVRKRIQEKLEKHRERKAALEPSVEEKAEYEKLKKRRKRLEEALTKHGSANFDWLIEFIKESQPLAGMAAVERGRIAEASKGLAAKRPPIRELKSSKSHPLAHLIAGIKGKEAPTREYPRVKAKQQLSPGMEAEGGSRELKKDDRLKIVPTIEERMAHTFGRGLRGVGTTVGRGAKGVAKWLKGPEATPEAISQTRFATEEMPVTGKRRQGAAPKEKIRFTPEGEITTTEELGKKLPERFKYLLERERGPADVERKVEGKALPAWAGLPSFGIARRIARPFGRKAMFASKEEERGAVPTLGEAGKYVGKLPLRAAAAPLVAGLKGAKKFRKRTFKELPSSMAERLKGRKGAKEALLEQFKAKEELGRMKREKTYAKMKEEHPEYVQTLEARSERARPQKYMKEAPETEAAIGERLKKEQPGLSDDARKKKAAEIAGEEGYKATDVEAIAERGREVQRAVQAGKAPPGYTPIITRVPGTKATRELEKKEKKAQQAAKAQQKRMEKGLVTAPEAQPPTPTPSAMSGASKTVSGPMPDTTQGVFPEPMMQQAARGVGLGGGAFTASPFEHVLATAGDLPSDVRARLGRATEKYRKDPRKAAEELKSVLKSVPDQYRAPINNAFNEWTAAEQSRMGFDITSQPQALPQYIEVPTYRAQQIIKKKPEYSQFFTKDPKAPDRMRVAPGAFQQMVGSPELKGMMPTAEEIKPVAPAAPAGMPAPALVGFQEPAVSMMTPRAGAPAAQAPAAQAPAGQPERTVQTPSGHPVDTGVLSSLFTGEAFQSPAYEQFATQHGLKRPGSLVGGALDLASLMTPMMLLEHIMPGFMGGMGSFLGAQMLAPHFKSWASQGLGYSTSPQEAAIKQMYANQLLRGLGGGGGRQPQAAPQPASTPVTAAG